MRESLPGYYRPDEETFKKMWQECLFVLDANVLLGLYRYSKEVRKNLIDVLKQISERLWIPHQVALEYQNNRLEVIFDQVHKFDEINTILSDSKDGLKCKIDNLQLVKRHSAINPEKFLKKIEQAFNEFADELKALKAKQSDISDDDKIRDEIDALLDRKIGKPFTREKLEQVYAEGKTRYDQKLPPGYKDKDKKDHYSCRDLTIQCKYGDLILWHQTLEEARSRKNPYLIFVTDDNKEDWWWNYKGRTIGPRPELVEEILSKTDVKAFYMYNSERFLQCAKQFLGAQVTQEVIDEVREVSQIEQQEARYFPDDQLLQEYSTRAAKKAVLQWLEMYYPNRVMFIGQSGDLDAILTNSDKMPTGVVVKHLRDSRLPGFLIRQMRGQYARINSDLSYSGLLLIFVTNGRSTFLRLHEWFEQAELNIPNISIIIGFLGDNGDFIVP